MEEKVKAYVQKYHMLKKEDKVIAGVSGGADSICLLFMLMKLRKEYGFELLVVHVNHCLRGEAALEDEKYVKTVCRENKIPCIVYRRDIEYIAKKRKQSKEEAGREARRECFMDAARKEGATRIALAHHMEDNAETLFLHLARGTAFRGLGGMYPVKGMWIRPLLGVSRQEIEEYLQKRRISYCTDSSNFEEIYTRNRVRKHLLPVLTTEVNQKAILHINQSMEQVRLVADYMETQADKVYKEQVTEKEGNIFLACSLWSDVPEVLRSMVIHRALSRCAQSEKDLGQVHVAGVDNLIMLQTGRKISLPGRMTARRTYEGIVIEKETENNEKEMEKPQKHVRMRVFKKEEGMCAPEKRYTKWFDYDIIKGNVEIRTRRPGDYLIIDKEGRRQKLKSYFINEKIPKEKRDRILLAADGECILWVVGYRTSATYQIGRHTKTVLEIQIDGGEKNGRDSQSIDTRRKGK